MKSKIILSLCPVFLAMLMCGGAQNAGAVELGVNIGGGHGFHGHDYRTHDNGYDGWYGNDGNYVYSDGVTTDNTYVDPYVYSSPDVGFDTFYGGGYRDHGGNYGGRGGYSGGHSSGGGRSAGGGHSGGGRR